MDKQRNVNYNERFHLLTRLPLLQGIGSKELAGLEQHMEMEELPPLLRPILKQGEYCGRLIFLVDGQLRRSRLAEDGSYRTQEVIEAPLVIEPEALFSLSGTYRYTYHTLTDCRFINLRRQDVTQHLMRVDIFRINFINRLALELQHAQETRLPVRFGTIRQRFERFTQLLFPTPSRERVLEMRMTDLADYLGETRLSTSFMLRQMQKDQLLSLGRAKIKLAPMTHPQTPPKGGE